MLYNKWPWFVQTVDIMCIVDSNEQICRLIRRLLCRRMLHIWVLRCTTRWQCWWWVLALRISSLNRSYTSSLMDTLRQVTISPPSWRLCCSLCSSVCLSVGWSVRLSVGWSVRPSLCRIKLHVFGELSPTLVRLTFGHSTVRETYKSQGSWHIHWDVISLVIAADHCSWFQTVLHSSQTNWSTVSQQSAVCSDDDDIIPDSKAAAVELDDCRWTSYLRDRIM